MAFGNFSLGSNSNSTGGGFSFGSSSSNSSSSGFSSGFGGSFGNPSGGGGGSGAGTFTFGNPQPSSSSGGISSGGGFSFGNTSANNSAASTGFSFGAGPLVTQSSFGVTTATGPTSFPSNVSEMAPVAMAEERSISSPDPIAQIEDIKRKLNTKFISFVFNRINPEDRGRYQRPEDVDPRIWKKAELWNPDSEMFFPSVIKNYSMLAERLDVQSRAFNSLSRDLEMAAGEVSSQEKQYNKQAREEIPKQHSDFQAECSKLLKLMGQLELRETRDIPIYNTEVRFRKILEEMKMELDDPNKGSARVEELRSIVNMQHSTATPLPNIPLSQEQKYTQEFQKSLKEQQRALSVLTDVLDKDLKDLATMKNALSKPGPARNHHGHFYSRLTM